MDKPINGIPGVITSPEKAYFRLGALLPLDQFQKRLTVVMTVHQRKEHSLGNAWLIGPDGKFFRLIPEVESEGPPKENFLFVILAHLQIAVEAKFGNLGTMGSLIFPCLNSGIQELLEKRAEGIFNSPDLGPLEKAKRIYYLIVFGEMEAKYVWVQRIHELAFDGGALTLFDAELCEAALYHAQTKFGLGRRYLGSG